MRWPTDITAGDRHGVAVWRDDRQSFAVLLETGRPRQVGEWFGVRALEFPTVTALQAELAGHGVEVDHPSRRRLGQLGVTASRLAGPVRLAGVIGDHAQILALVAPSGAVRRLATGHTVAWGSSTDPGAMAAASAALRSVLGPDPSVGAHASDFVAEVVGWLPQRFSLPADAIVEWARNGSPPPVEADSPAITVLSRWHDRTTGRSLRPGPDRPLLGR